MHEFHAVHVVVRWAAEDWNLPLLQLEHVRAAVWESAEIFWPAPHVGCVAHVVSRWGARQMHGCWLVHDPVPEKPVAWVLK